jgi:protein O-mannosyl-transferase
MMKLKKNDILIVAFLLISTFAVYTQVLTYDFVNYDDSEYVTENEIVKKGITVDSFVWSFTHFQTAKWHPLTWISHMLDCQFFGLNAGGHHLTNLIFHLLNSLLLYIIFRKMTGKLWQSGFVAALFALHPLHVESVAWISERKDVLSTFWAMLTILNYYWYTQSKTLFRFCGVILFFAFGLMSKTMLVTLPFVLLLIDYWPLNRFWFQNTLSTYPDNYSSIRSLFLEKTPLFFLSIISSMITLLSQQYGGAIRSFDQIPFLHRVSNAFVSYVNYIYKMIYPINLSILYPHKGMPQWWEIAGSVLLIFFITFFSIRTIKTKPYFIVGWLWFLGTLVPVIGFIQIGIQSMADRYTYLPLTGLFVIFAWGMPDIVSGWRYKKQFLFTSSFCLLFMLLMMTWQQVKYWENGETLSRRAVNVTFDNWLMENNLANMLVRKGEYSKGIAHYIESLRINPEGDMAYQNLMSVLDKITKDQSVAENMESVISLYPKDAALNFITGKMFRDEEKSEQAILYFEKTIKIDQQFIVAYYELSTLYMLNNEPEKSLSILKLLVILQPDSPTPYYRIARIYQITKNDKQATEWFRYAIEKGYEPKAKQTNDRENENNRK